MKRHYSCAPRNGIPVGGGDWMDYFFKAEAVRGLMTSLGAGCSLSRAIEDGKTVSEVAVRVWNTRREWQVHRWDKTCHAFLDGLAERLRSRSLEET